MNSITVNTKISLLFKSGRLSARAYNCLQTAGLQTVRDIFEFTESTSDLLQLRNLGKKSFEEILAVLTEVSAQYGGTPDEVTRMLVLSMDGKQGALLQEAYAALFPEETEVTRYFRSVYPDVLTLHKAVLDADNSLLLLNKDFSYEQNVALRKMTLRYLDWAIQRMRSRGMFDKQVFAKYMQRHGTLPKVSRFTCAEKWAYFFNTDQRRYLSLLFEDLKGRLSTRAVNTLHDLGWTMDYLIGLMEQGRAAYSVDTRVQFMMATMNELYAFNRLFYQEFDRCWAMSDEECALAIIRHEFPGFTEADYLFIHQHQVQYGFYPRFFLLYTYLCMTEERRDQIYAMRYGIRDGRTYDLPSLGDAFGLTQERVRQLSEFWYTLSRPELVENEDWRHYESLLACSFLTEGAPEWQQVKERERLPLRLELFHKLLSLLGVQGEAVPQAVLKKHKIVDFPYEFVNLYGVGVILNRLALPSLNIVTLANQLKEYLEERHEEDSWYNLDKLLVSVPLQERKPAKQLLIKVAEEAWQLAVDHKGRIRIPQNYVNLEKVLEKILARKGEPMSLGELVKSVKALCPECKTYSLSFIRAILLRSTSIRPIGKTGRYGLTRWGHIYFGSIRDALVELVSAEDEPLPLRVIYERIKKICPSTNLKSVRQLMDGDDRGRFTKFEGGLFGVSTKQYDDRFVPYVQVNLEDHFQECLKAFQTFVESEQHFPFSTGAADEQFLYRWCIRNEKSYCAVDKTHSELLRAVIKGFDERHIPRNKTEYTFQGLCKDYLAFVQREGALPAQGTGKALWDWFKTTQPLYRDWQDNRVTYFETLLQQLRELGYMVEQGV